MKTEVEFRELPEKVRGFLDRIYNTFPRGIIFSTEALHDLKEWSQATDDERLAYAEWRYPDGTIALFGEAKRRAEVRWPLIITGTGMIGDSNSPASAVYRNTVNKWAELVSEPEENQSIKDRLKGTCVKSESVEMGAEIVKLYMEAGFKNSLNLKGKNPDFYYGIFVFGDGPDIGCFSKSDFTSVLTLDQLRQIVRGADIKEASPEAQQEFVKANPGMSHVEGFVSGKIVNVWNRDDKVDFQQAKYRFFADGKHWVETCSADLVVTFKNIEKIADAELNEIADNLIACSGFYLSDKIPLAVVKPMLVEMGKKVKHGL